MRGTQFFEIAPQPNKGSVGGALFLRQNRCQHDARIYARSISLSRYYRLNGETTSVSRLFFIQ